MAVRVTVVPLASVAEQVEPQLMPPVLEVTVPVPVPDRATVRGKVPAPPSVTRSSTESMPGTDAV